MLFNRRKKPLLLILFILVVALVGHAQTTPSDSLLVSATLDKVVQYALEHQPVVKQAETDEDITNKVIKGKLADWYPQVNFTYNYQRFLELQSSVIGGNLIRFGVDNTSSAQFTATQNIFNRDVLLASRTASKVRIQADQNTQRAKIDLTVNVTKAFYDLLATSQQINVTRESIERLEQSVKDAYSRYTAGLADKTDYKRATILLSNAKVALKTNQELRKVKEENLRTLMGYPRKGNLPVQYDTLEMESQVYLDTTESLNVSKHIEYKILYTQRELQNANVTYNYWSFLPSVSLFAAYNLNYQNNNFGELYNTRYPYSYIGATVALPIFQGGKRIAKIQEQKATRKRIDYGLTNLENALSTEYARALASYKSYLAQYLAQKENVTLAQEVYDIIQLQYKNGVKTFLDVTIAETDLQTTRINYINALYQVLVSKADVLRAQGQINY
jgi:outer membrane protein